MMHSAERMIHHWIAAGSRADCRHYDDGDQYATFLTLVLHLKTSIDNGRDRVAVPVAISGKSGSEWNQRILHMRSNSALRTHMFHHQQHSSWLQDPFDLLQSA